MVVDSGDEHMKRDEPMSTCTKLSFDSFSVLFCVQFVMCYCFYSKADGSGKFVSARWNFFMGARSEELSLFFFLVLLYSCYSERSACLDVRNSFFSYGHRRGVSIRGTKSTAVRVHCFFAAETPQLRRSTTLQSTFIFETARLEV